jgi:hypothetical protein
MLLRMRSAANRRGGSPMTHTMDVDLLGEGPIQHDTGVEDATLHNYNILCRKQGVQT